MITCAVILNAAPSTLSRATCLRRPAVAHQLDGVDVVGEHRASRGRGTRDGERQSFGMRRAVVVPEANEPGGSSRRCRCRGVPRPRSLAARQMQESGTPRLRSARERASAAKPARNRTSAFPPAPPAIIANAGGAMNCGAMRAQVRRSRTDSRSRGRSSRLQIAQAAVQSAVVMKGAPRRRSRDARPGRRAAAGRGVPGRHQPADPPSDHEHVESPGGERIEITNHRGTSRTRAL